jgi:hypothetical protein
MNRVLGYVSRGHEEGAQLLLGGNRVLRDTGGYFVEPTVFDGVSNDMTVAREEIFGPRLRVLNYFLEERFLDLGIHHQARSGITDLARVVEDFGAYSARGLIETFLSRAIAHLPSAGGITFAPSYW